MSCGLKVEHLEEVNTGTTKTGDCYCSHSIGGHTNNLVLTLQITENFVSVDAEALFHHDHSPFLTLQYIDVSDFLWMFLIC